MSKRRNSYVWKYYAIDDANTSRAICLLCPERTRISRGGTIPSYYSTTPLARHLKSKHPKEFQILSKAEECRSKILQRFNPPLSVPAPVPDRGTSARNLYHLTVEEFLEESNGYVSYPRTELLARLGGVPDLGDRMGSDSSSSGKFDGPSTSFVACSPADDAVAGGPAPGPGHDPLLSDPIDQDELDDSIEVKPDVFEETLDDDISNSNSQPLTSEQSPTAGGSYSAAGMSGFYLLKKDTHCTTILDQLLHDETYADVTLTAQGGSIKAHRIVLSLASGYFREVLSKDSSVKNVIVFKDLKFAELKNVLNFIYTGEATVDAVELESFMSIAEMLEITSLCDGHKSLPKQFISLRRETRETSTPTAASAPAPAPAPATSSVSKVNKRTAAAILSSSTPSPSPPSKSRKIVPPQDPPTSVPQKTPTSTPVETIIKTEPEAYDGLLDLDYDDTIAGPSKGCKDRRSYDGYSPDDPAPGRCPYCPASAPYHMGEEMTVHLQMNHSTKPFINCHGCSRVFTLKSLYKKHQEHCKST